MHDWGNMPGQCHRLQVCEHATHGRECGGAPEQREREKERNARANGLRVGRLTPTPGRESSHFGSSGTRRSETRVIRTSTRPTEGRAIVPAQGAIELNRSNAALRDLIERVLYRDIVSSDGGVALDSKLLGFGPRLHDATPCLCWRAESSWMLVRVRCSCW